MEERLDQVEEGKVEWTSMLSEFYGQLKVWLKEARGPDGNPEEARDLIAALIRVKEWVPPPPPVAAGRGRGRRGNAGDQAFFESLRKQAEAGEKPLSDRQVGALKKLVVRYREQAPELAAAAEQWAAADTAAAADAAPAEGSRTKLELLKNVRFDEPRTIGRRVFDDSAFAASLRQQVEGGRALTDNQERYLDRLLKKYAEQIPDFANVTAGLQLGARETVEETPVDAGAVERLLDAFEKLTEWKPPQKRGKREWDDREFYRSVARQFRARGSISPRQFQALNKMAGRYKLV
jgi:hypothetical protein